MSEKSVVMTPDAFIHLPASAGIYSICHVPTGRRYVGSSVNIKNRARRHLYDLSKNKHHSVVLQRFWDKYDHGDFSFNVLELVNDYSKLLSAEQTHIDAVTKIGKSLNVCPVAGNCQGVKQTAETISKRSARLRGTKRTPEQCKRISEARKINGISPEHRELLNKMSFDRGFCMTIDQANVAMARYENGETWASIGKDYVKDHHAFYREMRKHFGQLPKGNTHGSRHPKSKVTAVEVIAIRASSESLSVLAKQFGLSKSHVSHIKNRNCWRHI